MRCVDGSQTIPLDLRTIAEIQRQVIEQSKRNYASRLFHSKTNRDKITSWTAELSRILQVFNVS